MIPALVLALSLGAADPCASVELAQRPDPAAAAVYRAVGDGEAAKGSPETAILAYRTAAALDPGDRRARAALERLCRAPARSADPARAGMTKMDAGDLRGAVADFRAARARAEDPSVALLEGVCLYELGEDPDAERALREAERSPDDADLARLYLGLVALRDGAASRAASLFDAAGENASIGPAAQDLARLARSEGRWALTLEAASGYDSNVNLAPPSGLPSRQGDGQYALSATGIVRPWGGDGPYLRGQGFLSQQLRLGTYDASGGDVAAGWQLRRAAWSAVAEYDYTYRTFDRSPFLSAHRLLASAWTALGGLTLGATYFARFDTYADGYAPFSGTLQAGEVRSAFAPSARTRVSLAYGLARDAARLGVLSYVEHGPRAEVRVLASRGIWVGADVAATFRGYDDFDPSLSARRSDTYLDAGALVEWSPSPRWTSRIALHGRRALSNVSGFEYTKLVPTVGLAYTFSP
jgi:tetratricopeptide (TPR) repeat protein